MHEPRARAPLLVWAGGAAFVLSLAVFLYSYFVTFGRPAASGPTVWPIVINTTLFTIFALHHSVLARAGAKRWLAGYMPAAFERSLYVWVASALFIAVCLAWQPVPGTLYQTGGLLAALHWLAVAVGVWLTVRGAGVLDPLELAGVRQASGETVPVFKVVGPYRWVRHPIYLGWVCLVFGVPHMTGTRLAFAILSTAYLVLAIPFEERSLIATFGETYRDYQRRVRWRLLPGLW